MSQYRINSTNTKNNDHDITAKTVDDFTEAQVIQAVRDADGVLSEAARSLDIAPLKMRNQLRTAGRQKLKQAIDSVNEEIKQAQKNAESVTVDTETGTVVLSASTENEGLLENDNFSTVTGPGQIMDRFNISPDEYEIEKIAAGVRDAGTESKPRSVRKLDLTLKRRAGDSLEGVIIRPEINVSPRRVSEASRVSPVKTVIKFSDQHAGAGIDWQLHDIAMQVIRDINPARIMNLGDGVDFSDISRYDKSDPNWSRALMYDLDCYQAVLADERAAAGDATEIETLWGNHCIRLITYLRKHCPEVIGVRQAGQRHLDDSPILNLSELLDLDYLNISASAAVLEGQDEESYIDGELWEGDTSRSIHGTKARKGSGSTSYAHSEQNDFSTDHGHNHRQAITRRTVQKRNGFEIYTSAEVGCMCRVDAGYQSDSELDWHPGFVVSHYFEDGSHTTDLASWNPYTATLNYGGQQWKSNKTYADCVPEWIRSQYGNMGFRELAEGFDPYPSR